MEMRNKNVDHARNIWDRACKHLPRVDQFWYKYAHMEEMLGELVQVRQIFEDWLTWEPSENAWDAYLKFEERNGDDTDRCRSILERLIDAKPSSTSFIKAAKYEEKRRNVFQARKLYERALAELVVDEAFLITFAKFEIKHREYDRANVIFKYGLEKLPKENQKKIN